MKEKQKPQIVGGKRKIAVPKPQPQEVDGEKKKKLVLYVSYVSRCSDQ